MKRYCKNIDIVFPACAGVIPSAKPSRNHKCSIPRVCGGDPRRRGDVGGDYAGGIPRVCGGDPAFLISYCQLDLYSPRVRG